MRRIKVMVVILALGVGVGVSLGATATAGGGIPIEATLSGYSEVPPISTNATGTFTATVSANPTRIDYTLAYSNLSSMASAAHIHFGQQAVNGGVVAFLCGGGGKPACPAMGGTVSGTIVAADIVAVAAQGIAAGELNEVLRAIANGAGYVNVHSANFPSGEIRGQIVRG
jgi:CHRD domain